MKPRKPKGIIFAPVNAYLSSMGFKTMTRRIWRPQPIHVKGKPYSQWVWPDDGIKTNKLTWWDQIDPNNDDAVTRWLRYRPGDLLYVKETTGWGPSMPQTRDLKLWRKSDAWRSPDFDTFNARADRCVKKWRSPMMMPRADALTWLVVESARIERLHDITEADAIAEGMTRNPDAPASLTNVSAFGKLWDKINGTGRWKRNPWVTVTTYRVAEASEIAAAA